jgi:predicted DNA-binding protein
VNPEREPKTVFFNIRLEPSVHQQLAELAARSHRTIAGEIRLAIDQHLAAASKEAA